LTWNHGLIHLGKLCCCHRAYFGSNKCERVGSMTPGCYAPFLGPVWSIRTIFLANEGWFNCDQVIIWMCFVCWLAKQRTAFKRKCAISGFRV